MDVVYVHAGRGEFAGLPVRRVDLMERAGRANRGANFAVLDGALRRAARPVVLDVLLEEAADVGRGAIDLIRAAVLRADLGLDRKSVV